ncbi:MAG: hypothetical protein Kow00121_29520 [Elainellaceae cyanobacterium]
MATLKQLLLRETNPFDPTTHKTFNFWDEPYNRTPIVESIHQPVITEIAAVLDRITQDQQTRSLILAGDSGSGKSIVLGRLRDRLNARAFFVYVDHWEENDYVWRHTLRRTVDSLLQVPAGQSESQLLLWLKSQPVFQEQGLQKWILGERKLFIQNMRASYPVGIYNPREFFGALYDLTNPELYAIAASWLKGDDLDDEDLASLKIKKLIDSEHAARGIIGNFGRVARSTYPIVLCFDNLDNVPQLPDGSLDLQPLFNINTTIHAQNLKNFLVVISLVTNNWKQALDHIQQADKASVYKQLVLRAINLEQAEQLWAVRLAPLHKQANPKPNSAIAPLAHKHLEEAFPSGRANPRSVLQVGYRLIEKLRQLLPPDLPLPPPPPPPDLSKPSGGDSPLIEPAPEPLPEPDRLAATFRLLWQSELKETQQRVSRFRQFSSPELAAVLRNTLAALQVKIVTPKLLTSSTYGSYSFAYLEPNQRQSIGIVWTEDSNMNSFFNVMKAVQKLEAKSLCQAVYLIRAESLGRKTNQGYKLYDQIFSKTPNRHLTPDINSLCYLVTYDRLARSAKTGDLLLLDQVLNTEQLETLIRETEVLKDCTLLQELEIFPKGELQPDISISASKLKSFIYDFVTQHQLVSQGTVMKHTQRQFVGIAESQVYDLIRELCSENRVRILDTSQSVSDQIVCLIPSTSANR